MLTGRGFRRSTPPRLQYCRRLSAQDGSAQVVDALFRWFHEVTFAVNFGPFAEDDFDQRSRDDLLDSTANSLVCQTPNRHYYGMAV